MKRLLILVCVCCVQFFNSDASTYTARDFGAGPETRTIANSLSQSGSVAGQYLKNDAVTDFYWNAKSGLHAITSNGQKYRLPHINNRDQVAGVASKQLYLFEPGKGLTLLGRPAGWEESDMAIYGFNDLGQILIGKQTKESTVAQFALWDQGRFASLDIPGIPMDLNSSADLLIGNPSEKASSIYNLATKKKTEIGHNKIGFALNDKRHSVGIDTESNEGFLWTPEKGQVSLGAVLPLGLNNNGQIIVGFQSDPKRQPQPGLWIDQTIIDLDQAVDRVNSSVKGLEGILGAIKINDKGQILVEAMIGGKKQVVLLDPQVNPEKK